MSTKYCNWGKHDVELSKWGKYKVCNECHAKMLKTRKKNKPSKVAKVEKEKSDVMLTTTISPETTVETVSTTLPIPQASLTEKESSENLAIPPSGLLTKSEEILDQNIQRILNEIDRAHPPTSSLPTNDERLPENSALSLQSPQGIFDENELFDIPENEEYNEPQEDVRPTLKEIPIKKRVTFQIPEKHVFEEKPLEMPQIKPLEVSSKIAEPNVNVGNFFSQFLGLF